MNLQPRRLRRSSYLLFVSVIVLGACSRAPEPPLTPPGKSVEDAANSMSTAEKKPGSAAKK
ncbi:hypothetical protein VT03_23135 [Planctomyces sp. SH-PL14]|nr:hypothetical protein VT03_23135 [Planctomyces sp. SH-PL14]